MSLFLWLRCQLWKNGWSSEMVFSLLLTMLGLDGVSNTADGSTLCGAMCFLTMVLIVLFPCIVLTQQLQLLRSSNQPQWNRDTSGWIFHRSKTLRIMQGSKSVSSKESEKCVRPCKKIVCFVSKWNPICMLECEKQHGLKKITQTFYHEQKCITVEPWY